MGVYIQLFCRSVVLFVFSISFLSKVYHVEAFRQTIITFAILPKRLSQATALLFLLAEALTVVLVLWAGPLLFAGYLLAAALLLIFCVALLSVLIRRISTSCSCFGPSTIPVSPIDIVRNSGFIICSLGGCLTLIGGHHSGSSNGAAWLFCTFSALIFVGIWTQLGEIVRLFR